jgi:hypothetical protein
MSVAVAPESITLHTAHPQRPARGGAPFACLRGTRRIRLAQHNAAQAVEAEVR